MDWFRREAIKRNWAGNQLLSATSALTGLSWGSTMKDTILRCNKDIDVIFSKKISVQSTQWIPDVAVATCFNHQSECNELLGKR
jgi:hypothetical protein